jgi:choline-phosphate cytidylyltransferase
VKSEANEEKQMTRSRQTNRDSSRHPSDESDETDDEKSPVRGRSGKVDRDEADPDEQLVAESSRASR